MIRVGYVRMSDRAEKTTKTLMLKLAKHPSEVEICGILIAMVCIYIKAYIEPGQEEALLKEFSAQVMANITASSKEIH